MNKVDFLKSQLTKPDADSKKTRMARVGLWGIGGFFLTGLGCMFLKPDTAGHVVGLVQVTIGAWTGIVMLYLGAQGSVDFATTNALKNTIEKKDETYTEHTIHEDHYFEEGASGSPERRPWALHEEDEE